MSGITLSQIRAGVSEGGARAPFGEGARGASSPPPSPVTLLDGGMGQELIHRAGDNPHPLWATRVMIDHPGLVRQVHAEYFAAGATIATANTYAIHHDRLRRHALDHRFRQLHEAALDEAAAAVAAFGAGRIAGSIGPLGASYRTDLMPPPEEAAALYAEIAALHAPRVDLLIGETLASLANARAFLDGARRGAPDLPLWLAVTVADSDGTRLRSGESLADLADLAQAADAVLVNCSAPEAVDQAMPILAGFGKPFGGYGNGFKQITEAFLGIKPTVDSLSARPEMTPERYADFAMGWVGQGATIVGGCCETGPAHISAIARRLRAAGHAVI